MRAAAATGAVGRWGEGGRSSLKHTRDLGEPAPHSPE